jgi:predicted DNA-binding protein
MISKSKGNQVQMAGYYSPEAVKQLRALSDVTRVPQSAYLREALDDLLKKYAATLRKATK